MTQQDDEHNTVPSRAGSREPEGRLLWSTVGHLVDQVTPTGRPLDIRV